MKVSSPLCGNCLSVRLAFTGAADALGYTQPAVSYQMRTSDGTISRPLRLRDEAVPEFPRDTRIGARSNPRTVI